MVTPRVGFIVYGVHKDGLQDPMGAPFIDDALVARSSDALKAARLELVEHDIVVASKQEARECFAKFRRWTTWTPCAVLRHVGVGGPHGRGHPGLAGTGKAIILWTHPGSQGWRPWAGW